MEKILLGITIGLLVILIILIGYYIVKQNKKDEENTGTEIDTDKINSEISKSVAQNLLDITNQFGVLKDNLNDSISKLNKDIKDNLLDNTKENKTHLTSVTESLTKITESQKKLEELNSQIDSLKQVLSVQQLTGRYGEEILENIITQIFGETHGLYEFQSVLSNGKRPDCLVNFPSPVNKLCIDSKFNFKEFNALFFADKKEDTKALKQSFKSAIKDEIKKVANDYLIKNETAEFVILFMPSDSIFNFIQNDNELYNDVYVFARKLNVILASPSSLQPILMTMNIFRINVETKNNIDQILKLLGTYKEDITRLDGRWQSVKKNLNTLESNVDLVDKSITKVVNKTDNLLKASGLEGETEDLD